MFLQQDPVFFYESVRRSGRKASVHNLGPVSDSHHLTETHRPISLSNNVATDNTRTESVAAETRNSLQAEIKAYADRINFTAGHKRRILQPSSLVMRRWDLYLSLLLGYTALVTPFEVAFLDTHLDTLYAVNRFVDMSFIVDMGVNCFLSYYDETEMKWIVDINRIRLHYFKTWFLVDFISILPYDSIDLFWDSGVSSLKVLRVVKLLKLFKLLRIFRSTRLMGRLRRSFNLSNSGFALCQFSITVVTVIHWTACVWRLAPDMEGTDDDPDYSSAPSSWIMQLHLEDQEMEGIQPTVEWTERPPYDLYLVCVEFSLMIMVMGYGVSYPVTSFERAVAIFTMLIGGSVYAFVIGSICGVVNMRDPAKREYLQAVDMLNQYMATIGLPEATRERVRDYYSHCRRLFRNTYYRSILTYLSPALRGEVANHSHQAWIKRIPFFNSPSDVEREAFVVAVAMRLTFGALAPNEVIFEEGDFANELYIIQVGMVGYGGQLHTKGSFFGKEMIMKSARRTSCATTFSFVDVYMLHRTDLYGILEEGGDQFYLTGRLIRRAAVEQALRSRMMQILRAHRVVNKTSSRRDPVALRDYKNKLRNLAIERRRDRKKKKEEEEAKLHGGVDHQHNVHKMILEQKKQESKKFLEFFFAAENVSSSSRQGKGHRGVEKHGSERVLGGELVSKGGDQGELCKDSTRPRVESATGVIEEEGGDQAHTRNLTKGGGVNTDRPTTLVNQKGKINGDSLDGTRYCDAIVSLAGGPRNHDAPTSLNDVTSIHSHTSGSDSVITPVTIASRPNSRALGSGHLFCNVADPSLARRSVGSIGESSLSLKSSSSAPSLHGRLLTSALGGRRASLRGHEAGAHVEYQPPKDPASGEIASRMESDYVQKLQMKLKKQDQLIKELMFLVKQGDERLGSERTKSKQQLTNLEAILLLISQELALSRDQD